MGIIPNFIDLGSYKDPDEFLTEKGPAAFEEKIKGSIPFLDHILNDLAPRKDAHDTESKINTLNKVFEAISPLQNSNLVYL